jgi:hypothetical protein
LNEKNRSNNDNQGEIAALREQIARREAEIFASQRDVQQKSDTAYQLRKDNEAAAYELQKLKEERARDQLEIDRLRDLNAFKERENCEADQRIKASDYDLFKLQERAAELAKIADMREFDLRRTNEAYEAASHDLHCARDELARLHDDQGNLSRALDLKMNEKADLVHRSEAELARNRTLTGQLYGLEAKSRTTDENLTVSRRE